MYDSRAIGPGGRWRLRGRLTLALVILFGAVFALSALSHYQNLDNHKESRLESLQQVQQTIAAFLDGFTGDLESFTLSTAIVLSESRLRIDSDNVTPEAEAAINTYLQHLFESYGILRAIFITDPHGTVVYSNEGGTRGLDLSDRSYIAALQAGAESYWSEGVAGIQSGQTVVSHSRRIVTPEGETTGFLVVAFYPESLLARLPAGIEGQGQISLFDQNGQLLLRIPQPEGGTPLEATSWPELEAARSGEQVLLRSDSVPLSSGERYIALSGLSGVDWVVGYGVPASAIVSEANAIFQRDLLLLGALLVGGLAVTLYLSQRVTQPLARLGNVAQAIARGEKGDELDDVKTSEADVSSLVMAMQYMRAAIQTREEQLSTQADVLESIERMGESLATELDVEKAIDAIIDAGVKLTSAETSLFFYQREPGGPMEQAGRSGLTDTDLGLDAPVVKEVLSGQTVHISELGARLSNGNGTPSPHPYPRSVLGIPIRSRKDGIIGALFLTHSGSNVFSLHDLRLARGLARWAGIVIENAELFRRSHEMQELLRRANEDKDEFLAMVSHELRTPITTIYGGSRLLHLRRSILNETAIAEMIASVAEEAERLYHLVEDLLAIARTEASIQVEREPVSVPHVINQTVQQFTRSHDRHVQLDVPEDLPPVLADGMYLSQIVGNLLSNADKYTPAGLPVEIEAHRDGSRISIYVRDHGPGVPDAELDRIFERFFRSEQSSSSATGKGLGLTVCKRLVESMRGHIEARNRPDGGFEVHFSLELADEEPELEEAIASEARRAAD